MSDAISAVSDAPVEIEQLPPGWATARVTYQAREGIERRSIQIIDLRTDPPMQYMHDSMQTISIKCALLVAAIPLFALDNALFHVVRIVSLELVTLGHFGKSLLEVNSLEDFFEKSICWIRDASDILCKVVWDLIRLPFLALEMQFCCLYGIIFPLPGRALVGIAERALKGSDRSYDLRRFEEPTPSIIDLLTNKDSPYCLFWAFCFQQVGPAEISGKVLQVEYLKP